MEQYSLMKNVKSGTGIMKNTWNNIPNFQQPQIERLIKQKQCVNNSLMTSIVKDVI